ncbi:MAG: DOMON-like domain-containing protein [Phenylobacterium sp.]|nr:DOMON-like domain-containing protein [Phenylobacterium sp.]
MHALRRHSDSPPSPISSLEAEVVRRADGGLDARFQLTGPVSALALPERGIPARRDELWRHTCFEVFLRRPGAKGYLEFNLAPSSDWALYAFDGYRSRLPDPEFRTPRIEATRSDDRLILKARIDAPPALPADQTWLASLTAVVESGDGVLGYWAVAHAPGRPDFHHADGFAVELPAPHPERP